MDNKIEVKLQFENEKPTLRITGLVVPNCTLYLESAKVAVDVQQFLNEILPAVVFAGERKGRAMVQEAIKESLNIR